MKEENGSLKQLSDALAQKMNTISQTALHTTKLLADQLHKRAEAYVEQYRSQAKQVPHHTRTRAHTHTHTHTHTHHRPISCQTHAAALAQAVADADIARHELVACHDQHKARVAELEAKLSLNKANPSRAQPSRLDVSCCAATWRVVCCITT